MDKTDYIYDLVTKGQFYFLSRPRRFGKSLLISTIESFFQGKRDLFRGLAIDSMDWDWQKHEVLNLDLNVKFYEDKSSLLSILDLHLKEWEERYGIVPDTDAPENRFVEIIKKAYIMSGRSVVIFQD